jgi:hypothetical protein
VTSDSKNVRVDQFLFGYADGHRLLAGSRKLSLDAASQLLLYSDLGAGASNGPEGYWTGIPIPSARAYALMHTWPAPEMPRPGCVWTQAILINFQDLAEIPDLAVLSRHFVRPNGSATVTGYGATLDFGAAKISDFHEIPLVRETLLQIVRTVYAAGQDSAVPADVRGVDAAVFAVWSQQWPRLRRTFSFRTAMSLATTNALRFDLQIGARVQRNEPSPPIEPRWQQATVDDIVVPTHRRLRRFLWRYGADVQKARAAFVPLAELYVETSTPSSRGVVSNVLLDKIVATFPEATDARTLKADILGPSSAPNGSEFHIDAMDLLDRLATPQYAHAFPSGSVHTIIERALQASQPNIPRLLRSIRAYGAAEPDIAASFLARVAGIIEPDAAVALGLEEPALLESLVASNPALLDSNAIVHLPVAQLTPLLKHLPASSSAFANVTRRLLEIDNDAIAELMIDKSRETVALIVLRAMAAQLAGDSGSIGRPWFNRARPVLRAILPQAIVVTATTTSELAAGALLLDLDVNAGMSCSTAEWADAVMRARDDLSGQQRQRLLTYLLALALARPARGCEPLMERSFEPVHQDIAVSRLPYDAFNALARYLPNLYWWEQWDTCLRLRLAVTDAYVKARLDAKSFARLAQDQEIQRQLYNLAKQSRDGRRMLESF